MSLDLVYIFDLLGTAVFAISGVLVAGQLRMDPFGVLVLASVTAVGGGTVRDVILTADHVFWVHDPTYLYVIIATALITMVLSERVHKLPIRLLPIADAFGLALFTVIGVEKALLLGASSLVATVMGVITGVVGGMIRDVLAGRVPMVLQKEIYATACILGGFVYFVCVDYFAMSPDIAMFACMSGVLGLRLAAIRWHLSLPTFAPGK